MPTFELYGYPADEIHPLVTSLRQLLDGLSYREEIVFVVAAPSRVIGWNGESRPFVRVLTRRPERAEEIRARINGACDVETVIIGFYPCTGVI